MLSYASEKLLPEP